MNFEEWWEKEPVSEFEGVTALHVKAAWNACKEECAKVAENIDINELRIGTSIRKSIAKAIREQL